MQTRKAVIGALYTIVQPLLLSAIGLPATAYVIRCLGPVQYGQWAIGVSLVGTVSVITSLGLRPLFVRRIVQDVETVREETAYQLGLRGLLALLAIALVLLVCLGLRYPAAVLTCTAITAFGLFLTALGGVLEDVLQSCQRLKPVAIINTISGTVLTALSVVAVLRGGGAVAVAAAYASGPFLYFSLLFWLVQRQHFPVQIGWNVIRYREQLREARLVGAAQILGSLRDRAEHLLVPKMAGIVPYGYFTAGSMLADRLLIVSSGLAVAFFPLIARCAKQDPRSASRHTARLIAITLMICLPLSLLITFWSQPIAMILFPENTATCREVLRITIWVLPLMGIWGSMGISLQAANAHDEGARAGMLTAICSILVAIVLTSRFGLVGACLSWLIRPAIGIVFYLRAFMRTFPTVFSQIPFGRIMVCGLGMAGVLWFSTIQRMPALLEMTAGACLACAVYFGLSLFLRVVTLTDLKQFLYARASNSI